MDNLAVLEHRRRLDGGWGVAPQITRLVALKGNGKVTLSWNAPEATVVDGQTICKTKGVIIRRSTDGYPTNELMGDLIVSTNDTVGTFDDADVEDGVTYYYRAFSFSDHNVYNREEGINLQTVSINNLPKLYINFTAQDAVGETIVAKKDGQADVVASINDFGESKTALLEFPVAGEWNVGGQKMTIHNGDVVIINEKLYGYDWDLNEVDTESSVTYPSTVDNYEYTPVPDIGANAEEIQLSAGMQDFHNFVGAKPVMLNFDGTVAYELSPSDQTERIDGTDSSIYDTTTTNTTNAMVQFPKRYLKRWTDENNIAHFRISKFKLSDDYKCYLWMQGNTEQDAIENDYVYAGMFESIQLTGADSVIQIRSLSATGTVVANNQSLSVEETQIGNLGNGWSEMDLSFANYIADLMILMGRSTDVQKHFGAGCSTGKDTAAKLFKPGTTMSVGPYYGSSTANTVMKFMWMENFYGNRTSRCYGLFFVNNFLMVKDFPPYSNDPSVLTNYANVGHGITGTSGQFIKSISYTKHGILPAATGGSSTTYLPDYTRFAANGSLRFGGYGNEGAAGAVGLTYELDVAISGNNIFTGPWLMYRPVH